MAGDYLANLLIPGYMTPDERQQEGYVQQGIGAWQNLMNGAPSVQQLSGSELPWWQALNQLGLNKQSAMAGVQSDPSMAQAQMNALGQLEGIAGAGGYTDAERAQIANAQRAAGNVARSNRLAAQSAAESRGLGQGTASLNGALLAQQGGANQASANANNVVANGMQRALQAMEAGGNLAGNIRGQGFNEAAQRAQAADAWNRGNAQMVQQQQQNLGNAYQTNFGNNLAGTQGITGAYNNAAGYYGNRSDQNTQQLGNLFTGLGEMGTGIYGMMKGK